MKKLIAIFILAIPAICSSEELISINQFSGLNPDASAIALQNGQTQDSENVLTDDDFGLQGRKGFVRYSTEPSAGNLWEFPLSNGTRYLITRSGSNLKATTDGTFSVLIGTVPTDRTVAATVLGDKFFFVDTLNGLKYWDGSSVTTSSKTMTFDKLVTFKGRLAGAGKSGSERIIFLSKYLDGTNWTLVTNPSEDDPAQITVSGSLDENIQALYSTFQDKLIYFKKNSFGGLSGNRRSTFVLRVYSDAIGVSSVETIRDCDGRLRWLGNNRKIYEFDGANFTVISESIDNIMADVSQGDANSRSTTLTTQSDFTNGTSSPTDFTSSSATAGSVVLATTAATYSVDTSASDFGGGTLNNLSTTAVSGSLIFSTVTTSPSPAFVENTSGIASVNNGSSKAIAQSFQTVSTYTSVSSVEFNIFALSGSGCAPTVRIKSNSSNTPGSDLSTGVLGNGTGTQTATMTPALQLLPSTTYWAYIDGCDGVNFLNPLAGTNNPYTDGAYWDSNLGISSTIDMHFKINFSGAIIYRSSGSITSRVFDIGFTTYTWKWDWDNFYASGTIPANTSITWQTQTAASSGGPFTDSANVLSGATPTSLVQRYIRYVSSFSTTDILVTPTIEDVVINTTGKRRPAGSYISPAIDFGTGVTSLGPFTAAVQTTGGSISHEYQTSTNSSTSLFLSTGWIPITSGSVSTSTVRRYAASRSSFTATSGTTTLSLDALTFGWTEGSTIKASSAYIDSRYWLGLAISSTANNRVLVYDKLNQWQRYSGYVPTVMGLYNSRLYVGNSNGIFLSESGYSDNGVPITAYYTSKTFAPSGFDFFSKLNYLYLTTDNSDNVLSPTFQIDANGTDNSFGSTTMNSGNGIQNLKYPFSVADVQQGKFINLKLSSTGSSFWRLLNANLYFDKDVVPN